MFILLYILGTKKNIIQITNNLVTKVILKDIIYKILEDSKDIFKSISIQNDHVLYKMLSFIHFFLWSIKKYMLLVDQFWYGFVFDLVEQINWIPMIINIDSSL